MPHGSVFYKYKKDHILKCLPGLENGHYYIQFLTAQVLPTNGFLQPPQSLVYFRASFARGVERTLQLEPFEDKYYNAIIKDVTSSDSAWSK